MRIANVLLLFRPSAARGRRIGVIATITSQFSADDVADYERHNMHFLLLHKRGRR